MTADLCRKKASRAPTATSQSHTKPNDKHAKRQTHGLTILQPRTATQQKRHNTIHCNCNTTLHDVAQRNATHTHTPHRNTRARTTTTTQRNAIQRIETQRGATQRSTAQRQHFGLDLRPCFSSTIRTNRKRATSALCLMRVGTNSNACDFENAATCWP